MKNAKGQLTSQRYKLTIYIFFKRKGAVKGLGKSQMRNKNIKLIS